MPTCDDCYFRKNGLCALKRESTCPTFRVVRSGRPEKPHHPSLLERTVAGSVVDEAFAELVASA